MQNYYLKNAKRIRREVAMAIPYYRQMVAEAYGIDVAESITRETMHRFEDLLPETPYIGGDENHLTENLYTTVPLLAFYQTLKGRGKTVAEIARLIYHGSSALFASFPVNIMLRLKGRRFFSPRVQAKLQDRAVASQEHHFPGDWVYSYVQGNGGDFAFGVDYTECGILKYLRSQGAEELAPYLCWLDVPMCREERVALMRTETLAKGDPSCNFRFSKWGSHPEMTPDFLEE